MNIYIIYTHTVKLVEKRSLKRLLKWSLWAGGLYTEVNLISRIRGSLKWSLVYIQVGLHIDEVIYIDITISIIRHF